MAENGKAPPQKKPNKTKYEEKQRKIEETKAKKNNPIVSAKH